MKNKVLIIGNFNVIHIGHLRLFSYAKKIANHLIVGVINDETSRANLLIGQDKRLDGVKSNKFVDEAYIINGNLKDFISKYKPNYFLKGKEFENQKNPEKKLLDKINCKLIFGSGDEQLSVSDIIKDEFGESKINNIVDDYDYCNRHNISKVDLLKKIKKLKNIKALVVGENIIDRYILTQPLGMSQETSLVVHKPLEKKDFLGGASIIAMHIANLISQTDYLSLIEKKDNYFNFINLKLKKNNINSYFVEDETYKTIIKTRYRLDNNTIFRTNEFLNFNVSKNLENKILKKFTQLIKNKNLLILSDFNYGFLSKNIVAKMIKIAKKLNNKIIISGDSQTSSQNGDISKFEGIDLITPTEIEARKYITKTSTGLAVVSQKILKKLKLKNLVITLNKNGILIDTKTKSKYKTDKINSLANIVVDTAGAGDAFITYTSLGLVVGANIWESSYLGSLASAIHVNTMGNEKINFQIIKNFLSKV